jgi:HEAT repeat protein
MGFKEDADFARFVSMGAVGTAAVADHLKKHHGHLPIELERYAMANKVWQTKVKRLRLPDLVCTSCGIRVESRAKSKLGIVLSHSEAPDRSWDAGGMRDDDLYAFLRADLSQFPPHVSRPWYFSTSGLRQSIDKARLSDPKAASEGSEVTLSWPAWVPARDGKFVGIDNNGRLVCEWSDGSTLRYWQWRNWGDPRFVYLEPAAAIVANETILAGAPGQVPTIDCAGDVWDPAVSLHSNDPIDRYSAIKAAGCLGRDDLASDLAAIIDGEDDWRVRLEAAGSLALLEPETWTDFLVDIAHDPERSADVRIEATFILSELPTSEALHGLESIAAADSGCPSEIRAAAAWGLGQGEKARPTALLELLDDEDLLVRLHAYTSISDLPADAVDVLVSWLSEGKTMRAAAAANLLGRHRQVDALLDAYDVGGDSRLWAIRTLGEIPEDEVHGRAGARLTDELEAALQVLWISEDDWVRAGSEGVEALDVQKVRFNPLDPSLDD